MKGKAKKFRRKTKDSFISFYANPRSVLQRYQLTIHIGEIGSVYTGCYANDPEALGRRHISASGDGGGGSISVIGLRCLERRWFGRWLAVSGASDRHSALINHHFQHFKSIDRPAHSNSQSPQ